MKLPKFQREQELAETLRTPSAMERLEKLQFGASVKKRRQKLGMKQSTLATKIKTSQSAVARIEAGKQNLTISLLIRISFALGKKLSVRLW